MSRLLRQTRRRLVVEAVAARPIPGRRAKLNDLPRSQLAQAMLSSPKFAGYAADRWTQALVARLKAIIFTESRRTQDYLLRVLADI